MKNILSIENLSYKPPVNSLFESHDSKQIILNKVSLNIEEGLIFGITGESGCGKTTLAKLIAEIYLPTKGKIVKHFEKESRGGINSTQMLFQNNDELINPLRPIVSLLNDTAESEDDLIEICELVGIDKKIFDRLGYQLSGGERQRVALVRLLLTKPKLLILDEPFSAQDPESQINLVELFKNINSRLNLTMICISHDIDIQKNLCDKIAVIYGGAIVETGNTQKLFFNPKHPYTKFLLNSCNYSLTKNDFGKYEEKEAVMNMCSYYNRCDRKSEQCINDVVKIESDELTTYCNHPY
ncbi:oligopeptide/dipeptide ABC transporter ATP-binding protein [Bacteroidota bacterium]